MIGADGKPVANALRNTAFQASALRTSLLTSAIPAFSRKFHVQPVAAEA